MDKDSIVAKANKRIPRHVFYRHYKGGTYRVLCVAVRESDLAPVVVYENADGLLFERPFPDWEELVDYEGRFIQRFVRLPEHVEPSFWPPRDDHEKFVTPETQLRKRLKEAYDAIRARADLDFLNKLRACGVPLPRMSLKEASEKLSINYDELVAQFEADLKPTSD